MTTPPCAGKWALFDSTDFADHLEAVRLCQSCHMVAECRERLEDTRNTAYGHVPTGTWAGKLYGRGSIGDRARIAREDASYSESAARAAHTAWNQGDRSLWAIVGQHVWDRRYRRRKRKGAAA